VAPLGTGDLGGLTVQPILPFETPDAAAGNPTKPPAIDRAPVPVYVRHPRARRYVVRVRADGSVRVTIPRWGSRREAERFAASQRSWIDRQLSRLAAEALLPRSEPDAGIVRTLRARAARELPPRLLQLAAEHGLSVSRVSIRNQQWRWGSCSPGGHICLNWRLVLMPPWVRDYVMIHELMHLKRMDHSPKFWKLVGRAFPMYQEARLWLRRNQTLLAR
jgi:predicted metal-dependent hydrolase